MKTRFGSFLIALAAQVVSSQAISVSLVYQNPGDPFFTATAQSTLAKAAADVSYAITTSLNALSQDVYSGTNGSTSASVNWSLNYTNPTTGSAVTLNTFNLPLDQVTVYVGARNLGGSLGIGGPSGASYSTSGGGFESEWVGAVNAMEAASNAGMVRGGPVLGTLSGTLTLGATQAPYDLDYGYGVGSLSLNSTSSWNLDYNTLPTVSQNDLYSVAVHEILHTIGFGLGLTWDQHVVSSTSWDGAAVIALLGSGTNVLSGDGTHIAEGLTGIPLVDGVWQTGDTQEALMDPTLTMGTRKYVTDLDLAFLRDMNWDTQVIPEPGVATLTVMGIALVALRRRTNRPI